MRIAIKSSSKGIVGQFLLGQTEREPTAEEERRLNYLVRASAHELGWKLPNGDLVANIKSPETISYSVPLKKNGRTSIETVYIRQLSALPSGSQESEVSQQSDWYNDVYFA